MNKEEVLKLSKLARIEIPDSEAESLTHEFESILGYVGEVKGAVTRGITNPSSEKMPLRNVLREDGAPHDKGLYTKDLVESAPAQLEGYIKVKQILS